ncbi:MAG: glycosyltransferase family 4 protein [Saprospiraceae bacterium]
MRILQLCKKFPFPLKDGEAIAVTYMAKALSRLGAEISLLSMNTVKHHVNIEAIKDQLSYYKQLEVVDLDNRIRLKDALSNLFSKDSFHISRFISPTFEAKLIELLTANSYDIILLESLYMAPYIPIIRANSKAIVVQRSHNVEYEIWERVGKQNASFLKSKYILHLSRKLKNYEIAQLNQYDLLLAMSDRDLSVFKGLGFTGSSMVVPIGLEMANYPEKVPDFTKHLSIAFIGSLDWIPNQEGLDWFLKEIWPDLSANYPNLTFHIAGRNIPPYYRDLQVPQVIIHGEVESAIDFMLQHQLLVVPLFSGSGMRVKILEALALGRIVISSTIGAEGIDAKPDSEILIANAKEDYLRAVDSIKNDHAKAIAMSSAAQAFARKNYSNLVIATKVLEALEDLIKSSDTAKK